MLSDTSKVFLPGATIELNERITLGDLNTPPAISLLKRIIELLESPRPRKRRKKEK